MKVSAFLDRRLVPLMEQVERHLLVCLEAAHLPLRNERPPLNLALVIDRSGSMAGSKLEKAKEAAIFCLRNLAERDRVAIVAYDDRIQLVSASRQVTAAARQEMIEQVRKLGPGGSTNLGEGWLIGAQEVAGHLARSGSVDRVLLLSDGLANVGITSADELAQHAAELRERGVSTTTMGIGADFDEELLERMALRGGGHFYFIEEAAQIPDFLHRELGELVATSVRQVRLELELPDGATARLLHSYECTLQERRLVVRIDDMYGGEERSALFQLTVPPSHEQREGQELPIGLVIHYVDVATGERRSIRHTGLALRRATAAACAEEQPEPRVTESTVLLEIASTREEALRLDREGRYEESATLLQQTAVRVRDAAPASPAVQGMVEALEEEATEAKQGMTAIRRKKMHYEKNVTQHSRRK